MDTLNGTKGYTMAFDINFGQYHFYIGKRQTEESSKKDSPPTIKQITQTYVKVGGDTILIRMNKDKTRYKASKGDFKVESGEGEDLTSFKNRIKEEYESVPNPKKPL